MSDLPPAFAEVFERGEFCAVAARTPGGLHLTPLVFAFSSGRLWLTTSRGSVKARAWRRDPSMAGLVSDGARAVSFTGTVRSHDALDPTGWASSVLATPALVLASTRFTRKNARFFAGYAVDARRVPLAWTPPGRVFVEIEVASAVLLEWGEVRERWRSPSRGTARASLERFRATRAGGDPLGGLPTEVAERVGRSGSDGALALEGFRGPFVLPAPWAAEGDALYASVPPDVLALASPPAETSATLMVDRASWWRARDMVGAMGAGSGEVFLTDRLESGTRSAAAVARRAGADLPGAALVRIRPRRLVWWRGWSSGTVRP